MKTPLTIIPRMSMSGEPIITNIHPLAKDLFDAAIYDIKSEGKRENCFYEALTRTLNPFNCADGLCHSADITLNNKELHLYDWTPNCPKGNSKAEKELRKKIENIAKSSKHKTPEDRLAFMEKIIKLVTGKTEEGKGYSFIAHVFTEKEKDAELTSDEGLLEDFKTLAKEFSARTPKGKGEKGKSADMEMGG